MLSTSRNLALALALVAPVLVAGELPHAALDDLSQVGDPEVALGLARAYAAGRGGEPDLDAAARWYKVAAALDHGDGHAYRGIRSEMDEDPRAAIGHWVRSYLASHTPERRDSPDEIDRLRAAYPRLPEPGSEDPWWVRQRAPRPRYREKYARDFESYMDRLTAWQASREARTLEDLDEFAFYYHRWRERARLLGRGR
jgi:hypothetical protein